MKMGQEVQMRLDKIVEGGCIGGTGSHRCGIEKGAGGKDDVT